MNCGLPKPWGGSANPGYGARVLAGGLMVLAAACGDTAGDVPSSVTETSTTTTTTTVEVTTTTPSGPVDLCRGRPVVFEPDTIHVAECYVVPIAITPGIDGWRTLEADADSVSLFWTDPDDRTLEVAVAILPFRSTADAALDSIVAKEGITALTTAESVAVGTSEALAIDIEGAPTQSPQYFAPAASPYCATGRPIFGTQLIHIIAPSSGSQLAPLGYGVGPCEVARVWAFEIRGQTLVVIAGSDDPERHDEVTAAASSLLESLTFPQSG